MVAVVWGVYVVYIIETYGATSTVVAVVWGTYPAYILNGAYMVYIVETNGNAEETGRRASHGCPPADELGIIEVVAAALRTRATTSGTR